MPCTSSRVVGPIRGLGAALRGSRTRTTVFGGSSRAGVRRLAVPPRRRRRRRRREPPSLGLGVAQVGVVGESCLGAAARLALGVPSPPVGVLAVRRPRPRGLGHGGGAGRRRRRRPGGLALVVLVGAGLVESASSVGRAARRCPRRRSACSAAGAAAAAAVTPGASASGGRHIRVGAWTVTAGSGCGAGRVGLGLAARPPRPGRRAWPSAWRQLRPASAARAGSGSASGRPGTAVASASGRRVPAAPAVRRGGARRRGLGLPASPAGAASGCCRRGLGGPPRPRSAGLVRRPAGAFAAASLVGGRWRLLRGRRARRGFGARRRGAGLRPGPAASASAATVLAASAGPRAVAARRRRRGAAGVVSAAGRGRWCRSAAGGRRAGHGACRGAGAGAGLRSAPPVASPVGSLSSIRACLQSALPGASRRSHAGAVVVLVGAGGTADREPVGEGAPSRSCRRRPRPAATSATTEPARRPAALDRASRQSSGCDPVPAGLHRAGLVVERALRQPGRPGRRRRLQVGHRRAGRTGRRRVVRQV